jgi:hypothetical protein
LAIIYEHNPAYKYINNKINTIIEI